MINKASSIGGSQQYLMLVSEVHHFEVVVKLNHTDISALHFVIVKSSL